MKQKFWFYIFAIIISLGAFTEQAFSAGVVNSVSYRSFPAGATISVRVLDNSDQNLALAQKMRTSLVQHGYVVSETGNLIMTIETREEIGGWTSTDRRHIVELSTRQSSSNDDSTHVKLNLFNSNTGGILNKGENSGTIIVTPSQFQINIVIENNSDGKRLWEGWASSDIGNASVAFLSRNMLPALVNTLNRTVNSSPF